MGPGTNPKHASNADKTLRSRFAGVRAALALCSRSLCAVASLDLPPAWSLASQSLRDCSAVPSTWYHTGSALVSSCTVAQERNVEDVTVIVVACNALHVVMALQAARLSLGGY